MKTKIMIGILISYLYLSITGFAYASGSGIIDDTKAKEIINKYNVVDTALFDGRTNITRNDGLSVIMRAIGTPERISCSRYGGNSIYADPGASFYVYGDCIFDGSRSDYVCYAIFHTNVVRGDKALDDGKIWFEHLRPITTNETLAFMVRCLDNRNVDMDLYNLEDTFGRAEDLSLIKETDAFYSEPDEVISVDEFFVLVQRFLYQKRYLYFNMERGYDFSRDEKGSMTYLHYLDETFDLGVELDT